MRGVKCPKCGVTRVYDGYGSRVWCACCGCLYPVDGNTVELHRAIQLRRRRR